MKFHQFSSLYRELSGPRLFSLAYARDRSAELLRIAAEHRTSFEEVRAIYSIVLRSLGKPFTNQILDCTALIQEYQSQYAETKSPCLVRMACARRISSFTLLKSLLSFCLRTLYQMTSTPSISQELLAGTLKVWTSNLDALDPRIEELIKVPLESFKEDAQECVDNDDHTGPAIERIKHSIGLEFEYILAQKMQALGLTYLNEEGLRGLGFEKTPDIMLQVPFEFEGTPIYWVESKGTFGDGKTMMTSFNEQFHPYLSRFGSGIVIYWYGFIEDFQANPVRPSSSSSSSTFSSLNSHVNNLNRNESETNLSSDFLLPPLTTTRDVFPYSSPYHSTGVSYDPNSKKEKRSSLVNDWKSEGIIILNDFPPASSIRIRPDLDSAIKLFDTTKDTAPDLETPPGGNSNSNNIHNVSAGHGLTNHPPHGLRAATPNRPGQILLPSSRTSSISSFQDAFLDDSM